MKSIYRYSKYGFLEIDDAFQTDKADVELAVLCVSGVYGAGFAVNDKKLHVIFNPERTNLYEISCAIVLTGYHTHLHKANKTAYSFFPLHRLRLSVYYVNRKAFIESIISGLDEYIHKQNTKHGRY